MERIELSKRDAKKMRKAYEGGESLFSLSESWGMSIPVIRRTIESAGGSIRKPGRYAG